MIYNNIINCKEILINTRLVVSCKTLFPLLKLLRLCFLYYNVARRQRTMTEKGRCP